MPGSTGLIQVAALFLSLATFAAKTELKKTLSTYSASRDRLGSHTSIYGSAEPPPVSNPGFRNKLEKPPPPSLRKGGFAIELSVCLHLSHLELSYKTMASLHILLHFQNHLGILEHCVARHL